MLEQLQSKNPESLIRPHNTFLMLLVTLLGNPGYMASDPLSGALGWGLSIPGNLLSLPSVRWNCDNCRGPCPAEDDCTLCNKKSTKTLKKLLLTLSSLGSIVEAGRNGLYLVLRTNEESLLGGLANQRSLPLPSGHAVSIPLTAVSLAISVFNFYLLYGVCDAVIDNAKDIVDAYRHPDIYAEALTKDKNAIAEVVELFEKYAGEGQFSSREDTVHDQQGDLDPVAWVEHHAKQILDVTRRENIQKLAENFRSLSSAKKSALLATFVGLFVSTQLWIILEIASVEAVVISQIFSPTDLVSVDGLVGPLIASCAVLGLTHGFGMAFLSMMGYGSLAEKIADYASTVKGRFVNCGRPDTEAEPSSWLWTTGKIAFAAAILGSSLAAAWYTSNNLLPSYCLLQTIVESFTGTSNVFTPTIDFTKLAGNNSYLYETLISNFSTMPTNSTQTLIESSGLPTVGYLAACLKAGTLTSFQKAWVLPATVAYSGMIYAAIPCAKDIIEGTQSAFNRLRGVCSSDFRAKRAGLKRTLRQTIRTPVSDDSREKKYRKGANSEAIPMLPQKSGNKSQSQSQRSSYDNVSIEGI